VRPSPTPPARRAGFTLIELLICVVVVGILAAVAVPKFGNTKGKANVAAIRSDLHNLVTAQETYFYERQGYAASTAALGVSTSPGVRLTIAEASATGWSATATHPAAVPLTCAVFYGGAAPLAPATREGVIHCE
jgi:prepilin-type N-terminal cleavage/methylation domain-containing protein